MADLQLAHSALLDPEALAQTRTLIIEQFASDPSHFDWENALGGLHALLWEEDELIGHAAVIQRRLLHRDRALRAAYFEGVTVKPGQRRRGHGARMMTDLMRRTRGTYEISALCSNDAAMPFYKNLGWVAWRGPLRTLTPDGICDDPRYLGRILVLEHSFQLDLDAPLACDWRDGDPWD